jgi:hypothetical protein
LRVVCKTFVYENPFGAFTDLHIVCFVLAAGPGAVNTVPNHLVDLTSIQDTRVHYRRRFQTDWSHSFVSI